MAHDKSRLVLLCQHVLALGVVVAVTAPAANLVTLDIEAPGASDAAGPAGSAPDVPATRPALDGGGSDGGVSTVADRPVKPTVSTVALKGVSKAGLRALREDPSGSPVRSGDAELTSAGTAASGSAPAAVPADSLAALSAPLPVDGLATVGVTWSPGEEIADSAINVTVRTQTDGAWSTWTKVPYHEEEGPDRSSTEGREGRPGTDPIYVGAVDQVQVRAVTDTGVAPAGMKLALVDPGAQHSAGAQQPDIDTNKLSLSSASTGSSAADGSATLASTVTSKPKIYSRAQWGADERMRDRSSLHYGEVHGGFVHHTVNANGYSKAQVPSIIRGIYAYHTQSRGWSDVGYNFLIDRFGRIWEGRAGGVDRPVVGAHTLGYNDDAFAASAIGNYDVARPSSAVVAAYGRLMAWKLSLHGVKAGSTRQYITSKYFHAISGHRDAGQTACPGRYLYAQIPNIRAAAARAQAAWSGRNRAVAGAGVPAMVMRNRTTKEVVIVRTTTAGGGKVSKLVPTGRTLPTANLLLNVGDWDGDGRGDLITRSATNGRMYLYRGTGSHTFASAKRMSTYSYRSLRMLTAVGDMTGDGRPDLIGQKGGSVRIYEGNGSTGFRRSYVAHSALTGSQQLGVGLWTADGAPDTVLLRRSDGSLRLYPGNGPGGLTGGSSLGSISRSYDWAVVAGDVTGDRRADLVVRTASTGRLSLLPGTKKGFGAAHSFVGGNAKRFDLAN